MPRKPKNDKAAASSAETIPDADRSNADKMADRLRSLYELADVRPPDGAEMTVPTLYWGLPVDEMASQIADHLRGKNLLFLRDDTVGTVDAEGRFRPMDSDRFRTWLPGVAGLIPFKKFNAETGRPVKTEIKVESARGVLASDQLRSKLPILEKINLIRMPVFREELDERGSEKRVGFRKIELLRYGYDAETKTYTVRTDCDFDENLDPNEGVKFFRHLLKYFDMDERSRAVQMSALLTVFGAGLFYGRSPFFVWNSPHGGSGKSRLAQLAAQTVYPSIGRAGYHWKDPGETRKEMDAAQQARSPILWFDDVTLPPGMELRNTDINRWLTSDTWQCRIMSTQQIYTGPLTAATFLTGTHLELDEQLFRRTLFVDIFPRMKARDRKIPEDAIILDDEFFRNQSRRGQILAGLWAMVRWWDENDRMPALSRPLESFENWSRVIPAIVSASGFSDALAHFEAPDAGERVGREMKELVRALVIEHGAGRDAFEVRMKDVVRTARMNGLFVDTLGTLDDVLAELTGRKGWEWKQIEDIDPDAAQLGLEGDDAKIFRDPTEAEKTAQAAEWMDKSVSSKWGKQFRSAAVAGQWFPVEDQVWQFGDRRDYQGSKFEVKRIEAPAG